MTVVGRMGNGCYRVHVHEPKRKDNEESQTRERENNGGK